MMIIIQRGSKKYYFTHYWIKANIYKARRWRILLHILKLFDGVNELNLKPKKGIFS